MHLKSRAILGAATVATAIGAALVPATSAVAAGPTLTATSPEPSGYGLQSGDSVAVSGTGFKASSPVFVVECNDVKSQSNCDIANYKATQTDASGNFSLPFPVHTGTVGDGTCGPNSTCYVVASTDQTGQDLSQTGAAQIVFDHLQVAPRTNLHNGDKVTLSGAGFKPSTTVYVSECTGADPTKATQDCQTSAPVLQTYPTDANGAFGPVSFTVATGHLNADGSKCDAGKSCIIAASDNILNPGDPTAHIGGAIVQFAAIKPLSVAAHASVRHIAKGKTFKVIGKATSSGAGVVGLNAVLDKVVNGSLQKVAAAKTVSGGAVVFKITQRKTTNYKVVIAAQKGYAAASSKTFKVATP